MTNVEFVRHTIESAPEAARDHLEAQTAKFGFLASPLATMAESPALLEGALTLFSLFEKTSLDGAAREVVAMTLAHDWACGYCMAMHSRIVSNIPALAPELERLRAGLLPAEPKLAAVASFVRAVVARRGAVEPSAWTAFLEAGYTKRQGLEIVLGIAAYTLSVTANHMTKVDVDPPFEAFRWTP
ncbi:MAG: carboxymuconolactone decarboxylase family protein [Polyangiaceae bacterium]|nr:carboxymuconolactone decarboxylase family protein [Polyangiaceae bacterium]